MGMSISIGSTFLELGDVCLLWPVGFVGSNPFAYYSKNHYHAIS